MRVIHGRVLAAGGEPVAAARVFVVSGPGPVPDVAALTGADGSFTLAAPRPGRYRVGCATDAGGAVEAGVDVAAGDVTLVLRLR